MSKETGRSLDPDSANRLSEPLAEMFLVSRDKVLCARLNCGSENGPIFGRQ